MLTPLQPAEHAELANQLRAKLSEELHHAELSSAELKRLSPGTDDFTKRQSSYNESLDMIKVRAAHQPIDAFPLNRLLFFLFSQFYRNFLSTYSPRSKDPQGEVQRLYVPKAIGVLSRFPFYAFFKDYLCQLVWSSTRQLTLPIERYIVNLVQEAPVPPRGKVEVEISLDLHKYYIARPALNEISILKNVRRKYQYITI